MLAGTEHCKFGLKWVLIGAKHIKLRLYLVLLGAEHDKFGATRCKTC